MPVITCQTSHYKLEIVTVMTLRMFFSSLIFEDQKFYGPVGGFIWRFIAIFCAIGLFSLKAWSFYIFFSL